MEVRYYKGYSYNLNREMEFKVYGHRGKPVLFIPCQAGRFYDFENFHMDDVFRPYIDAGEIMVFSIVTQKKTIENDGYEAVQIGYGEVTDKHLNKPMKGHFAKADVAAKKFLREFRADNCGEKNVGDLIKADTFAAGDKVDVCGISKGKGYQGVIKRFGAHSLKDTHGTGPVHRHAGSNGANSTPSRVYKGKILPGHMGVEQVTVQNLEVVKVDAENNLIALKGAIPGPKGGIVTITDSVKA